MCQVLTTRARDQGSRPQPSLLAETLGKDLRAPEPSWPPTPASLPSHAAPAHRSVASTSPTAATRGSSAPCSCPPSPPCAPTPSPGPTTSANETKANRLGPGRSRPGPPPHPDPARHDPRWSPLRPPTSHETTRSRLTHHIGAPREGACIGGAPPACGGMSAAHSSFGLNTLKCLSTRSAGHCSRGALRVVRGDLARLTPRRLRSPMRRTGGTAGHVTGTVTLGALRAAPYHVHLAGPQHRVAGSCGPWISPP